MASILQKLVGQALKTFRLSRADQAYKDNFQTLRSLLEEVSISDFHFKPRNTGNTVPHTTASVSSGLAPVTYMHIWEDEYFTVGIFLLKHGCKIPLHDHPNMCGILKVLYGDIRVRYYDRLDESSLLSKGIDRPAFNFGVKQHLIPTRYDGEVFLDSQTGVFELGSTAGNFHDIHAIEGPAAFLDILAPPYDPPQRDCTYFSECTELVAKEQGTGAEEDFRWLRPIQQPSDFWCDYEEYPGPEVNLDS
ncbi:2-aminoethanethiol dioxygenase-like [Saccoglossus kowalevskii]|uniref:2-aminoethanethiol dioxygenase-like n=1 Tax=Saccoglossus kowalevskii TaxID=10224 RepID=A0ABM0GSS3_SACKO|nr:PREDICTED: 2-aminoethanethiol dioxygenase-like [Saccoglossus kowalevskii]